MNYKFPSSKRIAALAAIYFLFLVAGCAGYHAQHAHQSSQKFDNINKWVEVFEDPARAEWQKPDDVVQNLNLKTGDVVADIGAGTGYFTRLFAAAVGPQGKAVGLDIESSMVEHMKEDARKRNLANYEAQVVKPDDPGLEPQSVDVVFICNTFHHINDRAEYLNKLSRALKANGRIVIVDFYKKPLPVGPRMPEHKLSETEVKKEFTAAGFHLTRSLDFLPYQYFLEFALKI